MGDIPHGDSRCGEANVGGVSPISRFNDHLGTGPVCMANVQGYKPQ